MTVHRAFVLAAGFGERLRPLTEKTPKPLLPVGGVPSICYSLALLKKAGVRELMVNLHYLPEEIKAFFNKNSFGFDVHFSFEEEILGTGGGLKICEDFFDSTFVVINSDIITDLDLGAMIARHRESGNAGTVALCDAVSGEATVSVTGERVVDFRNFLYSGVTPEFDYMGAAVLEPEIFRYLVPEFSSIVYTGYTDLIGAGTLGWYHHRGLWKDVGTLENYRSLEEELKADPGLVVRTKNILAL